MWSNLDIADQATRLKCRNICQFGWANKLILTSSLIYTSNVISEMWVKVETSVSSSANACVCAFLTAIVCEL